MMFLAAALTGEIWLRIACRNDRNGGRFMPGRIWKRKGVEPPFSLLGYSISLASRIADEQPCSNLSFTFVP